MQLPIDNLVAASKNQADILGYLTQTIQNGLEGQTEMKIAVQEIMEKSNGYSYHVVFMCP